MKQLIHEKKQWRIYDQVIESITPWGALGIFLEKGRFGLHRDHWRFTKMPRGVWVATFIEGRNLERPSYRIIELENQNESKKADTP
jgi:hypothetical protein